MAVSRIAAVSLTVPDLEAAVRFYGTAFGFVPTGPAETAPAAETVALGALGRRVSRVALRLGHQHLELTAFDPPGRPYPPDSTASDLWFQHCAIVVGDMAAAYRQVAALAVTAITVGGPQRLPPHTGSVTCWKFRDPSGHPLELLCYPAGVGDPVWQRADAPLFRGIDHTAVAVGDAGASIRFYEELGFAVLSRSVNSGAEQSRLDGFDGAEAEVVALAAGPRPGETPPPHLELLAYRSGTRRPRPAAWSAADVAASRTVVDVGQGGGRAAGRPVGRVSVSQDPDGHLVVSRDGGGSQPGG